MAICCGEIKQKSGNLVRQNCSLPTPRPGGGGASLVPDFSGWARDYIGAVMRRLLPHVIIHACDFHLGTPHLRAIISRRPRVVSEPEGSGSETRPHAHACKHSWRNTIGKAAEHNRRARRHWLILVKITNVKI